MRMRWTERARRSATRTSSRLRATIAGDAHGLLEETVRELLDLGRIDLPDLDELSQRSPGVVEDGDVRIAPGPLLRGESEESQDLVLGEGRMRAPMFWGLVAFAFALRGGGEMSLDARIGREF